MMRVCVSFPRRQRAAEAAHDAGSDGARKSERTPDRDDELSYFELIRVAQDSRLEGRVTQEIAADDREVRQRVPADHLEGADPAVGERRRAPAAGGDDVGRRDHEPVAGDDDGRAGPARAGRTAVAGHGEARDRAQEPLRDPRHDTGVFVECRRQGHVDLTATLFKRVTL